MDKKKVILNRGEYVFCFIEDIDKISINNIICSFKESKGYSIIISKEEATSNNLPFYFISAWITLNIDSTLDSVGLTSSFSRELTKAGISCNVVAAYHHDHIYVPYKKRLEAVKILSNMYEY